MNPGVRLSYALASLGLLLSACWSLAPAAETAPAWKPQLLRYDNGTGALLLIGARHTRDPADPQIGFIQNSWNDFKPTLAYFEGNGWNIGDGVADTVRQFGESGFVRFMALATRVPVTALEPDLADEIGTLQPSWSDEQIKLFYALRPVAQNRALGVRAATDEEIVRFLNQGLPSNPGVHGPPETLAQLNESVKKLLGAAHWRDMQDDWFNPASKGRFTNDIARASSDYRNRYMLQLLTRRLKAGERVIAVVGASHVAELKPQLDAATR